MENEWKWNGLQGVKNVVMNFFHECKYGKIKKYTPCVRVFHETRTIKNGRDEKESSKVKFENKLLRQNIKRWEKGDFNTYGLPMHETDVRDINIVLMEWFKKKWLQNESEEKVQFYLWLEDIYFQGLLDSERNKKKHFKDTYRQYQYSTKVKSLSQIGQWITELILIGAAILLGNKAGGISNWIRQYLPSSLSWFQQIGVAVSFIVLIVITLYVFRLVFQTEYRTHISKVNKSKETWVRHLGTVVGYQKELLDYLWDSGEYGKWKFQEDRDAVLIERIMHVWENNLKQFQYNMREVAKEET